MMNLWSPRRSMVQLHRISKHNVGFHISTPQIPVLRSNREFGRLFGQLKRLLWIFHHIQLKPQNFSSRCTAHFVINVTARFVAFKKGEKTNKKVNITYLKTCETKKTGWQLSETPWLELAEVEEGIIRIARWDYRWKFGQTFMFRL